VRRRADLDDPAPISVGEAFAARLRQARQEREWRQQDLAAAVTELGLPMDRTTLAKIEKGQRQPRLEEFVALAAALGVDPGRLLVTEDAYGSESDVRVAPRLTVSADTFRSWLRGAMPLNPEDETSYFTALVSQSEWMDMLRDNYGHPYGEPLDRELRETGLRKHAPRQEARDDG
jgi:transcriptional regulator with XRE-family HTH domain